MGRKGHENRLINFLNAILEFCGYKKITKVTILNPYNDKDFLTDKLSIVDIKAEDSDGKLYQIEVHLSGESDRIKHILYTWCRLFSGQIKEGGDYKKLKPVISIWLMAKKLIFTDKQYHHRFGIYDEGNSLKLTEDCDIHVLEISKWQQLEEPQNAEEKWLYLFKEGSHIDVDNPPAFLKQEELEEALTVMREFSEKERQNEMYEGRVAAQRILNSALGDREEAFRERDTMAHERDTMAHERDTAVRRVDTVVRERDALAESSRAEIEALKERLKKAGLSSG